MVMPKQVLGTSLFKLMQGCLAFETLFYLPNRFVQILMVNSKTVQCKSNEVMLLDLMEKMFGTRLTVNQGPVASAKPFSVWSFLSCYKHFFHSTMLFEGISAAVRLTAFEYFKTIKRDEYSILESLAASFAIGSVTQGIVCSKLFARNIINHTEESLALKR